MPLATIQQMINTCQGLDDLQGIAMPNNYISANVGMGKANKLDQPTANPGRARCSFVLPGFDCPPETVLGLNYCLYGAKQTPAHFKSVSTEFMLAEGFTAVNDSQTV
jgi:hypothetical protein